MSGVARAKIGSELLIQQSGNPPRSVPLVLDRYRVGRGTGNEIALPEDAKLSREHMVLERAGGTWQLRDCGSSNGTRLNGTRLDGTVPLRDGDQISAGSVLLVFHGGPSGAPAPKPAEEAGMTMLSIDLAAAIRTTAKPEALRGDHLQALLRAGRELAAYGELDRLFDLILDLSLSAVGARRGALLMANKNSVDIRVVRGNCPPISKTVLQRVLGGESLLIEDTLQDTSLAQRQSILESNARSILAVPLQTDSGISGMIYLDNPFQVRPFTEGDLSVLTVLSNIAAVRIEHARLLEVERAERLLARELDQAAEIQQRLLPSQIPQCPEVELDGHNSACRGVGGDYYDFWAYPDGRVLLLIADVAGKGMPAALLMSSLQACVHVLFEHAGDLAPKVSRLNRYVALNTLPQCYITFFVAILDPVERQIHYCNAGHNPPVLTRKDGVQELLPPTGMVLGLIPGAPYEAQTRSFGEDDSLLLYSDGASEACRPGTEEEFGEEGLAAIMRQRRDLSATQLVQHIRSEVERFTCGSAPADDVTLVVARGIRAQNPQ